MQVMPALLEQSAAGMQAGPAGMGIPLALYKCVFPPSPPPSPRSCAAAAAATCVQLESSLYQLFMDETMQWNASCHN